MKSIERNGIILDPITTAIIAALTAGVVTSAGKLGESILVDAYDGLKSLIKQKFGEDSNMSKAIKDLEQKPESSGRRETLKEEIKDVKADEDPEIIQAARNLLDNLGAQPDGEQHIQNAIGSNIAQADRGGTANVNIGNPNHK
jgi:hypothetical protein